MRKVILYISCSLDGYIAKPGDDLSFLERVEKEGENYGYAEFYNSVDTVIMGRRTYEWVKKQISQPPHTGKKTYVITRELRQNEGSASFYADDIEWLVEKLKYKEGKDIFIDGGAEVVRMMMNASLLDELIISIIPVILGKGTTLFSSGIPESDLELISTNTYYTGLVQLRYRILDNRKLKEGYKKYSCSMSGF